MLEGDKKGGNRRQNPCIKMFGPWGGDGGSYKDIKLAPLCLNTVAIRSGRFVYSISFSYSDEHGIQHHAGPWGTGDTLTDGITNTIQFGPTEFLTGISGTIGSSLPLFVVSRTNVREVTVLHSLTFITNTHQYGPFGGQDGAPFRSPLIGNSSSIVGFFGRSGVVVDAIGIYVYTEREPMEKQDSVPRFGLWGGDSGMHYDVEEVPRRLISMVVCSGKVIDSLTFIYTDRDGHHHTAGPWGGLGASKKGAFHTIMLGHSEIVKEVSGTVGMDNVNLERLTSLLFVTNITTYGPFGDGGGMPFRSPSQENDSIVGFFAKAGKHITAIGFYAASIEKEEDGAACMNQRLEREKTKLDKDYFTKIGPWGGCNGHKKDIEVAPLCLNSVTIRSGEVVFSIAFSYMDDDGKQQHAGPWGASEGFSYGAFNTIQLEPLECLTEVSGTIDYSSKYSSDVVTSVMFITNLHEYGPYGGGGGIPFRSPVLSSGSLIGFFAHAEKVVDAIGLYVNHEREPLKQQDSIIKIGPWGGDSGRPNDVDVLPRRLISVVVHCGKVINSLTFTYIDCNGQEHTAGPWGRTAQPLDGVPNKILLGQYDFLMEVSGTVGQSSEYSTVVTSLTFVTNSGSYGPYGKEGGTRFRSPPLTNGSIVGFFVSAEDVIGAIGVYVSRDRVDIRSAFNFLEQIILDEKMDPTNVPLALLQHITENFSDKREIGRGGFGVVYKGELQNGSVAVKKLLSRQTIKETLFYREATSMISVKHKNIVRLLGYCANTEVTAVPNPNPEETMKFIFAEIRERLLCFEYINNGSLENYLTDELRGLEWHTRFGIIEGICNGLDYLHNEKSITHRDLKPANILVDDLMVPKISDFGTSKLLEGATHAVTSSYAFTRGYAAPEFLHGHEVSFKSDIYSLGAIIREIVTGHKGDPVISNVLRRWRHRWNKSSTYPPFGYQQVSKCIEIASTCLSHSPKERPNVRDILSMLNATGSRGDQINSAGESPVGPIRPYPWELLEFDKLELNFPLEIINKEMPCSLELTNVTDDYVAFDIQKTGTLHYFIEPNKGVVPPRSLCTVIVTLQALTIRMKEAYMVLVRQQNVEGHRDAASRMWKDESIVVRCAAVNEGLAAEGIHEDMFDSKSSGLVDEVTLTVVISCDAIAE